MISRNTVDQPIPVSVASAQIGPCTSARVCVGKGWSHLLILVTLMLPVGCASVARQTVPKDLLVSEATVLDMPEVRAWGDG
jgi:hypothetical protein